MEKGDKIIDKRDNSVEIVDSIDVYDTVTLVFTESKKYIPLSEIKEFTNLETLKEVLDNNPEIIKDYEEKVTKRVVENFESHLKNVSKKLGLS